MNRNEVKSPCTVRMIPSEQSTKANIDPRTLSKSIIDQACNVGNIKMLSSENIQTANLCTPGMHRCETGYNVNLYSRMMAKSPLKPIATTKGKNIRPSDTDPKYRTEGPGMPDAVQSQEYSVTGPGMPENRITNEYSVEGPKIPENRGSLEYSTEGPKLQESPFSKGYETAGPQLQASRINYEYKFDGPRIADTVNSLSARLELKRVQVGDHVPSANIDRVPMSPNIDTD